MNRYWNNYEFDCEAIQFGFAIFQIPHGQHK